MTRKTKKKKKPAGPRLPVLRIHKQSGRCYATFNGRPVWFGHKSDPDTQTRFDAYLAQWLARGRRPEEPRDEGLTVRSLVARYLRHLEAKHDESWHRNNSDKIDRAFAPLLRLHGTDPALSFSPLRLKAVRQTMISSGKLSRGVINARVQIIRRCFRWAASEELVPPSVHHGLQAVDHLRAGEFGVREGKPRGPVAEEVVFATLPHLHSVAAALVELLWWTGARPSELFGLSPQDIDRSGDVWVAKLAQHKTARKGKARELDFGPQAQRVLRRFLDRVPRPAPDRPIFSPQLAVAEHLHERREARQTPLYKSHIERYEREAANRERRRFADRYTAQVLRTSIERAVGRANRHRKANDQLPVWTPYQLRHAALTRIRANRGLEAAKAVGGHATVVMTEGYSRQAERDLARRVASELG